MDRLANVKKRECMPTARVQILHFGLKANLACCPGCRNYKLACMQILHSGLSAKFSDCPGRNICILANRQNLHQGGLGAKTARLENAEFARLVSAKFARDSINYLINYF
jgi:hypothetical protein